MPLQILVLNLMPTKIATETQLARLLGNTPLQIEMHLMKVSHEPKHTAKEHMLAFYKTFDDVREEYFDGMVITGAPVEKLPFEEVDYWEELCVIMEWSRSHVYSTFHICWGAQAGLYYHYGIDKAPLPQKLSGVFVLACVESGNPEYAYSGWLFGFIHLVNALYKADTQAYYEVASLAPPAAWADIQENNDYWARFETKEAEVTEKVYDSMLKSYGQPLGVQSYGAVADLLIAWYLQGGFGTIEASS